MTCPYFRYHPAIIAQAAATVALLSDGRFTLGIGAGERLNEHVVGRPFPAVRVRHEMLREAIEIIRLLWQGGYQSYDGKHLQPGGRPGLRPAGDPAAHAGGRRRTARRAPGGRARRRAVRDRAARADLVRRLPRGGRATGRSTARRRSPGRRDEDTAAQAVLETSRWALTGWKVMSELPNPVNFEAASATVRKEDVVGHFACGPDLSRHLEVVQPFVDVGFDHIVLQNAGPDPDGFLDFFTSELAEPVRALTPSRASG